MCDEPTRWSVMLDEEVWSSISGGQLTNITLEDFVVCMKRQLKLYMETLVAGNHSFAARFQMEFQHLHSHNFCALTPLACWADEMLMATLTDGESRPILSALKLLLLNVCVDTQMPSIADTVHRFTAASCRHRSLAGCLAVFPRCPYPFPFSDSLSPELSPIRGMLIN